MHLRIRDIVGRCHSVWPFGLAVFSSLRTGLGTKRWFSSHGVPNAHFIPTTRRPHDSTPVAACPPLSRPFRKNSRHAGATDLTKVRSTQAHSGLECPE